MSILIHVQNPAELLDYMVCEYSIFQGNTKLFQSSRNNLHSCQQCIRNSTDPHALQYLHHQTCFFLHKMPVYDFCPFSYCIIYSILCRHSLYIVDISTFSVVCVKIFSQIVSIFVMASFDKQMFLFLIQSNPSFLSCLKLLTSPKS